MRCHPCSNRLRACSGSGASRGGRALTARTMPTTTATIHIARTASTISVTTSIAAPPSERNASTRVITPCLRGDLPPAGRLLAIFWTRVFLDNSPVVKQRQPHALCSPFAFLAGRLAAGAPHVGRQLLLGQRMLALAKHGKQQSVGFPDGIARRIHEAALNFVPLRHVALARLRRERLQGRPAHSTLACRHYTGE